MANPQTSHMKNPILANRLRAPTTIPMKPHMILWDTGSLLFQNIPNPLKKKITPKNKHGRVNLKLSKISSAVISIHLYC